MPKLKQSDNHNPENTKVSIISTKGEDIITKAQKREDGSIEVSIDEQRDYDIRPLYAAMPPEEQLNVFEPVPKGVRKFILSTNIAETSVTISGVKYGKK